MRGDDPDCYVPHPPGQRRIILDFHSVLGRRSGDCHDEMADAAGMQAKALLGGPCNWCTDLWYLICECRQEKAKKSAYDISEGDE